MNKNVRKYSCEKILQLQRLKYKKEIKCAYIPVGGIWRSNSENTHPAWTINNSRL